VPLTPIELSPELEEKMKVLDPVEREVFILRFGLGGGESHTLRKTAELVDLPDEKVTLILRRALKKLRYGPAPTRRKKLKDFLE